MGLDKHAPPRVDVIVPPLLNCGLSALQAVDDIVAVFCAAVTTIHFEMASSTIEPALKLLMSLCMLADPRHVPTACLTQHQAPSQCMASDKFFSLLVNPEYRHHKCGQCCQRTHLHVSASMLSSSSPAMAVLYALTAA
jgi:hypothetical protein